MQLLHTKAHVYKNKHRLTITWTMMGNTDSTANVSRETNYSDQGLLPYSGVIYTPFIVVQLLVGLASNLLLFSVLIKSSVTNNINIYLCSMAANNLLSLFLLLTLMVTTATQRWVFGQTMCTINQVIAYAVGIPYLLLPAFISRERYRAVLHFFEWKPYTKRTYIEVGGVWMAAIGAGLLALLQGRQIVGETDNAMSCYSPSRWPPEPNIVIRASGAVLGSFVLLFSVVHYIYIFRQLHVIKKNNMYPSTGSQRFTYQDIPMEWKSELQALYSMASTFIFTATSIIILSVINMFEGALAIATKTTYVTVNAKLLKIAALSIYLVPTASPMVFIVINKRFRTRAMEILHLMPPSAITARVGISMNDRPSDHQLNNDSTVNSAQSPQPSRPKILYNTWMSDREMTHL